MILLDGRGGVFAGESLETLSVWSNTRYFFLRRPDGGEKEEEYGPGLEVVGAELMIGDWKETDQQLTSS